MCVCVCVFACERERETSSVKGDISRKTESSGMKPVARRKRTELVASRLYSSGLFSSRLAMNGWPFK